MLLPSKDGRGTVKEKLRTYKVNFEEVMIRFCDTDVLAYKIKLQGTVQYSNIETRHTNSETHFHIITFMGDRANFKIPLYCDN